MSYFEDDMSWGTKVVIAVMVIAVIAFVLVIIPLVAVWFNLWVLNNIIYRWTPLGEVPAWTVYMMSLLMLIGIGSKTRVSVSKE